MSPHYHAAEKYLEKAREIRNIIADLPKGKGGPTRDDLDYSIALMNNLTATAQAHATLALADEHSRSTAK